MSVNVKNGIFGPGGHGGGIFQTTVSGMGSLGSWDTKQGVFGPGGHGGGVFQTTVGGLGAFDPFTGISSVCWDEFGFKGCSEKASQSANDFLYTMKKNGDISFGPGSPEWEDKYNRLWNEGLQACVKQYCGASTYSTSEVKKPTTSSTKASSTPVPATYSSSSSSSASAFSPAPTLPGESGGNLLSKIGLPNVDPDQAKKLALVAGGVVAVLVGVYFMRKK